MKVTNVAFVQQNKLPNKNTNKLKEAIKLIKLQHFFTF